MDDFLFKELLSTKWKAEDFRNEFDQQFAKCLEDLLTCITRDSYSSAELTNQKVIVIPCAKGKNNKRKSDRQSLQEKPVISQHNTGKPSRKEAPFIQCHTSPNKIEIHSTSPSHNIDESMISPFSKKRRTEVVDLTSTLTTESADDHRQKTVNSSIQSTYEDVKAQCSLITHHNASTWSVTKQVEPVALPSPRLSAKSTTTTPRRSGRNATRKSLSENIPDEIPIDTSIGGEEEAHPLDSLKPLTTVNSKSTVSRPTNTSNATAPRALSKSCLGEKRVFQSVERLGGASRLASLGKSPSTMNTSVNSRLGRSVGASSQKLVDRSALVIAAREQLQAEKQRTIKARIEENEKRVKAVQEARKAQQDAARRLNEDRRQAVKMRAFLVGNKLQMSKAKEKPKFEQEKTKENISKLFGALMKEGDKENSNPTAPATTAAKPGYFTKIAEIRLHKSNSNNNTTTTTTVSQVSGSTSQAKTPGGQVLRPHLLTTNHQTTTGTGGHAARQPLPRLPPQTTGKPAAGAGAVAGLVKTQVVPAPQPVHAAAHKLQATGGKPAVAETSLLDSTFDVSKLNSDSDSDDDQPKRKIPAWSRRGSPELIAIMEDIYKGKMQWQDEFLPAAQIPFDIAEVFRGYEFRCRPRTSSAVWAPNLVTCGQYPHGVAI